MFYQTKQFKKMIAKMLVVLLVFSNISIVALTDVVREVPNVLAASHYEADAISCPIQDNSIEFGVSCSGGWKICGADDSPGKIYCYDNSTLAPGAGTTTETTSYGAGFNANGGFVIDCYNKDAGIPYCDNQPPASNFWCNRKTACYNDNRVTECAAGIWSSAGATAASCPATTEGSATGCITGYYNCNNGDNSACESSSGSPYKENAGNNAQYNASCTDTTCTGDYIDCDDVTNDPDDNTGYHTDPDGCEWDKYTHHGLNNSEYTTGGTYAGFCGVACRSGYMSCATGATPTTPDAVGDYDAQGCNLQSSSTVVDPSAFGQASYDGILDANWDGNVLHGTVCSDYVCSGATLDCDASTLGANRIGDNGTVDNGTGDDGDCEQTNGGDASGLHGANSVYQSSTGDCQVVCATNYYNEDLNPVNGCEIQNGSACTAGSGGPGTWNCTGGAGGSCVCDEDDALHFMTGGTMDIGDVTFVASAAQFYTSDPLLWGKQLGDGALITVGNSITDNLFTVENDGAVYLAQIAVPGVTSDRLYNVGGGLYWNGSLIGSASGGSSIWDADTDTGIQVEETGDEDVIRFDIGDFEGTAYADILKIGGDTTGGFIWNDAGEAALDLRVEGDTVENLLFVDASTNRIGIGTNSPAEPFHVAVAAPAPRTIMSENTADSSSISFGHDDFGFESMIVDQNDNVLLGVDTLGNVGIKTNAVVVGGGLLSLKPTGGGVTRPIVFNEIVANGTNYVGFKAPDDIAADIVWTLPSADGTNEQVLQTDGSGVLSWADAGSGDAIWDADTDTGIQVEETGDEDVIRFDIGDFEGTAYADILKIGGDTTGGLIWNDAGEAALDFRIAGDTDANLFFADASADKVGIGTDAPAAELDVSGSIVTRQDKSLIARGTTNTNLNLPLCLFVAGEYAYVGNGNTGYLSIFNISDPDSIVAEGYAAGLQGPTSVYVSGNYAYVANYANDTIRIIDVSNPDGPVLKDGTSDNLDSPRSIYVSGRYAYVASRNNNRLVIFDITDPDNIAARGYIDTNLSNPNSVYVSGDYAYLASTGNDRLAVFDISDPDAIVAKDYIDTNLSSPSDVKVSGGYAFVLSGGNNTLAAFDISNPNTISFAGNISTNISSPSDLYLAGGFAYVANQNNTLAIYDISDPSAIVAKSTTSTNLSIPYGVVVSGKYAYLVNRGNNSLAILELGGVDSPSAQIGALSAYDFQVQDNMQVFNDLYVRGGINMGKSLMVQGDGSIAGDMRLAGLFYDENNEIGTPGQILSTTATGTDWIDAAGGSGSSIWDTDTDTGIQVEEVGDEDVIRFDIGDFEGTAYVDALKIGGDTTGGFIWNDGGEAALDLRVESDNEVNALFVDASADAVGIGTNTPTTALHIDSNAANTTALLTLENTAGDFQLFRTDATPESAVTGSVGDLTVDGTNGDLYIKNSGAGTNTGWKRLARAEEVSGGPTSITKTTASYNGAFSSGGYIGYEAANDICNGEFAGSHFCRTDEVIQFIAEQSIAGFADYGWMAEGPPGYTSNSNDCSGWTSSGTDQLGAYWAYDSTGGGKGWLVSCETTMPLSCCQ